MITDTDFKYHARMTATMASNEPYVRLSKSTGREKVDQLFTGMHGSDSNKNMQLLRDSAYNLESQRAPVKFIPPVVEVDPTQVTHCCDMSDPKLKSNMWKNGTKR